MPKRLIKRFLPDHQRLRDQRLMRFFGNRLHDPDLWHLNRRSVSGATGVGLFAAFLPIPLQMVVAAAGALLFRVNLPMAVALVWLTNPITIPPVFYATYRLGAWLMGIHPHLEHFSWNMQSMMDEMAAIWKPLLLGSLLAGTVAAVLGMVGMRLLWRWYVVRKHQQRKRRRTAQPPRPEQ